MLLVFPVAVWEFSFGIYMTVRGFTSTAASDESATPVNPATPPASPPGLGGSLKPHRRRSFVSAASSRARSSRFQSPLQ